MLNFRRVAALAVTFTFTQLQVGVAPAHCPSHRNAGDTSAMEHMAMTPAHTEAQQMPMADAADCDDCAAPDASQPCDDTATLGCMSMSSCATVSAEQASAPVGFTVTAMRTVTTQAFVPASATLSQDTPPPRV